MDKLYKHDCDECTYIGQIGNHDIYHCEHGSIRARYGDEGSQYMFMPMDMAEKMYFEECDVEKIHFLLMDAYNMYLLCGHKVGYE